MPDDDRVVIATGNPGKLREIVALLGEQNFACIAQSELGVRPGPETGVTFVENALQKARHAAARTGLPAIADDSGIVVDALEGRPGVYSARYAGEGASDEDNVDKLLAELGDVDERAAHFHCAAVFIRHTDDPEPVIAEASWYGTITRERHGSGGFGYDPVFHVPACGCTSAELAPAKKNELSHRGLAFRRLAQRLAVAR
ncbi:MAG: RdgB/HAM1 family non-canonical purine NTP pyrophosphatase [Pseudomonadota bacterium]